MQKSEVYSWRVSPALKAALEERARRERQSVGALLDRIATEWLAVRGDDETDERIQRKLRTRAMKVFGALSSGEHRRAETARELIVANARRLE